MKDALIILIGTQSEGNQPTIWIVWWVLQDDAFVVYMAAQVLALSNNVKCLAVCERCDTNFYCYCRNFYARYMVHQKRIYGLLKVSGPVYFTKTNFFSSFTSFHSIAQCFVNIYYCLLSNRWQPHVREKKNWYLWK
jgi:hypothetical protein